MNDPLQSHHQGTEDLVADLLQEQAHDLRRRGSNWNPSNVAVWQQRRRQQRRRQRCALALAPLLLATVLLPLLFDRDATMRPRPTVPLAMPSLPSPTPWLTQATHVATDAATLRQERAAARADLAAAPGFLRRCLPSLPVQIPASVESYLQVN